MERETKKVTMYLTPDMQDALNTIGETDHSGKNLSLLFRKKLSELQFVEKQLLEDALWLVEQYHGKYSKFPMSDILMTEITKRKRTRNICRGCNNKIAVERGLCAKCLAKQPTNLLYILSGVGGKNETQG